MENILSDAFLSTIIDVVVIKCSCKDEDDQPYKENYK